MKRKDFSHLFGQTFELLTAIREAGETRPLSEWCELIGVNYYTAWSRIFERGWDAKRALTPTRSKVPA